MILQRVNNSNHSRSAAAALAADSSPVLLLQAGVNDQGREVAQVEKAVQLDGPVHLRAEDHHLPGGKRGEKGRTEKRAQNGRGFSAKKCPPRQTKTALTSKPRQDRLKKQRTAAVGPNENKQKKETRKLGHECRQRQNKTERKKNARTIAAPDKAGEQCNADPRHHAPKRYGHSLSG